MFCTHCGAQIPDHAAFCPSCGQPVSNVNQPNGTPGQAAGYTENPYGSGGNQPQGRPGSPADAVMKIGKSPLTLVFTIVFSVYILLDLYNALFGYGAAVFDILMLIIEIPICVGCWLVYVSSSQNRPATTGFSILRVMMLINLVFQLVGMVTSYMNTVSLYSNVSIVAVVLLGLVGFAIVGWAFYGLCRTTNDGWKILNGEAVKWRVNLFCVIFLMAIALMYLVEMIIIIISSVQFLYILDYLALVATYVLAIIILFEIRSESKRILRN